MNIALVPLNFPHPQLVEVVKLAVSQRFGATCSTIDINFSLEAGRDPYRNQVNSTWILGRLQGMVPEGIDKLLGMTSYDLFVPVLTYVFGEAVLDGSAAIVSAYRFRDEFYGRHPNQKLLESRLVCESIHEMGHAFGLTHCDQISCVMRPNVMIEQVDAKSSNFCLNCAAKLEKYRQPTD